MQIKLAGMVAESIVDGPGIRCAVFVQGCPHACEGCHNPQTHDFTGGTDTDVDTLLATICKHPFVKAVTLSGGEPFCQAEALAELAVALRAKGYDIMAFSGFTFEQLLAMEQPAVRTVLEQLSILIDGRFEQQNRDISLRFRGSSNQRVLDVPQSLTQGQAVLHEKYK